MTTMLALLLMPPALLADDWHYENVDRVVAIADIHGALDAMAATLQSANVIDDNLHWVGGETHLVIVGDILDRGPDSRAAMELLMRLEGEATTAGGKVHVLFGNHESMPMTGDLRYVSPAEFRAFADDVDSAERERWYKLFVKQNPGDANRLRVGFEKKYPPGYFAMRRAFRADGRYGEWLLKKDFVVVINGTAFVHGGLPPLVADIGLNGINREQKRDLIEYVKALAVLTDAEILLPTDSHYDYATILTQYMPGLDVDQATLTAVKSVIALSELEILSSEGPLWYRGSVACSELVEGHRLNAALTAIGAERVVVGHTPTPDRKVLQRYAGRLIEIDTGMLGFYYKGSGNALVLEGETVAVINQADSGTVMPVDHPRHVGHRPKGMSVDDLTEALRSGVTLITQQGAAGTATLVAVSHKGKTVNAVFQKRQARGVYPEVAAYRLDRLLGLDMVPVTVIRDIEGISGSLQFMPANRSNEAERSAARDGYSAHCPIQGQWEAMYLFDVLTYNQGRTSQRITYDRSSWQLILTGHERTFAKNKGRPPHLRNTNVVVNASWTDALAALTDDVLEQHFSTVLDARRRKALADRRDQMLISE